MESKALRDSFDQLHRELIALLAYCQKNYRHDPGLVALSDRVRIILDDLYAHYWQLDIDIIPKDEDEILN